MPYDTNITTCQAMGRHSWSAPHLDGCQICTICKYERRFYDSGPLPDIRRLCHNPSCVHCLPTPKEPTMSDLKATVTAIPPINPAYKLEVTMTKEEAEALHQLINYRIAGGGPARQVLERISGALMQAKVECPNLLSSRAYVARDQGPILCQQPKD
jgi:hypothetical protein